MASARPLLDEFDFEKAAAVGAKAGEREEHGQRELLRDIFPNPCRPASAFDSSWRTPAVLSVAQEMYRSRDFSQMSALADALEAAGCTEPAMLEHCRSGREHWRGCWVVDLVLDRG